MTILQMVLVLYISYCALRVPEKPALAAVNGPAGKGNQVDCKAEPATACTLPSPKLLATDMRSTVRKSKVTFTHD